MKVIKGDGLERGDELYTPLTKLPAPIPRFKLNSDPKFYYKSFGPALIDTKKLAKVDLIHLHKLAVAVYIFQEAVKAMNEKGYDGGIIQTFSSKVQQISPHITAQEKANKVINDVSKHFGMSFKNRYDLKTITPVDDPAQTKIPLWENFGNRKLS